MKGKVLLFRFSMLSSFHPAGLFLLSSLGCRTDFRKCCCGQSRAFVLSVGRTFPATAQPSGELSGAVVRSLGWPEPSRLQRNPGPCGKVWARRAWQKWSLVPFHRIEVSWANQRCDGKSKLSSFFFYLHANVVIVINSMRSGCLWLQRNVLSSQNKNTPQLTQRLNPQITIRRMRKRKPRLSESHCGK